MTNQSAFSAQEWNLLGDAPLAACAAVALVEPGGAEREESAIFAGWREAGQLFPQSELLQQIARSLDPERRDQGAVDPGPLPSPMGIRAEATQLCRQAMELLRARATPQEADDYRAFVLHLVNKVAAAASEGGFLGLGGQPVSQAEQSMIAAIELALE